MRILLIDADSKIPNLSIMKMSTYFKSKGYVVDFKKLEIPYYPSRVNYNRWVNTEEYDKCFCSVVFDGTKGYIKGNDIVYGGTGSGRHVSLPDNIERCEADYSLYPDNNTSYGFISRGCIRNCYFCKVPKKEGTIRQVNVIDDIVRHDTVKFLDNNILALPNHKIVLQEIVSRKIKCNFIQGLDFRLLDDENSELLSKINYMGEYIFAFDDIKQLKSLQKKVRLLSWAAEWGIKFYVYVHPKMDVKDTVQRIEWLKNNKFLPYIMRDISCFYHEDKEFYADLCAWCNQPGIFKNMEFLTFLQKRHKTKKRDQKISRSWGLYKQGISLCRI